ncbi:MAG: 30S ribosomal protein S6 [Isosphaera sp.]|nr:30S ribosomal protein S6 [Isosphaera sp.]
MPVVHYETMFLLDPNKVASDADGTRNQIHTILERHGGAVVISRPWDYNHKLSYPINKQKKGSYHIVYYTMESTRQAELERDFALQEGLILRQLTLKLDPKWRELILDVAREDQGNGFALRGMKDEAAVTTDPAAIGGAEPAAVAPGGEEAGPPGRDGGPPRGPRGPRGPRPDAEKPE